jgi:hypothetical protein
MVSNTDTAAVQLLLFEFKSVTVSTTVLLPTSAQLNWVSLNTKL